jgi:hypothetical protein
MDTGTNVTRPNIQIDDVVREMTEEQYAVYLVITAEPDTPTGD